MKIYHTETQEDYDALMEELERYGVNNSTSRIGWHFWKQKTCVQITNNKSYFNYQESYAKRYPDIPIVEFKANETRIMLPNNNESVKVFENSAVTTGNDPINPKHYTQGELEVIDILQDKLTAEEFEGFLKGNILKYTFREGIKNGTEDMKKGAWYMARLIEFRKGKEE